MLVLGLVLARSPTACATTLILLVQIASLLTAITLAVLFTTGVVQFWQVCLLTSVFGCGWACDFSARRSLLAQLSGSERAGNALSLEAMTNVGNKVVAAAFGGVVLAVGGPKMAYWWLVIVHATAIIAILHLRRRGISAQRTERATIPLISLVRLGWTT